MLRWLKHVYTPSSASSTIHFSARRPKPKPKSIRLYKRKILSVFLLLLTSNRHLFLLFAHVSCTAVLRNLRTLQDPPDTALTTNLPEDSIHTQFSSNIYLDLYFSALLYAFQCSF